MAERPDLDAMRERADVMKAVHWFCAWAWERTYSGGNADREALFTYCRELKAENQRLRQQIIVMEAKLVLDPPERRSDAGQMLQSYDVEIDVGPTSVTAAFNPADQKPKT